MIKSKLVYKIRKLILIYLYFFSGKTKFKFLSNLNFKIIDFSDYEKNENLIFKKNFFKMEKNSIVYNYDFINLCKKLGGKRGIELAKQGIFRSYELNKFKTKNYWQLDQIANRILNMIYNFDFVNSISNTKDEYYLKRILKININAFNRFIFSKNISNYSLLEFKVYILIKLILNEDIKNLKNKFELILENQLDSLSIHKTYNFFEHAKFINNINEIVLMLLNFNNVVPEIFNMTKLRMETALAQYFHKDGTIALFNGTSNYDLEKIKSVLIRKQNIRKLQFPDDYNGVYYFEDKNKKIFIDAIQPNSEFYSKTLSAGTLSLEFSSNKEKIITNCGAVKKNSGNASYLRYSAAHSTVILENTNISEIKDNQPHIKFPQLVSFKKEQEKTKHTIEISHNGYIKNYKKIIKRKISFEENRDLLIGEDSIISSTSNNKEVIFHIRFHILPYINITQTNNKKSVILKTRGNFIWLFETNKDISIEESIFMDKNKVKETKQIVIKGIAKQNREKIRWTLSKK